MAPHVLETLLLIGRISVALLMLLAAAGKARDLAGTRDMLRAFGVSGRLVPVSAIGLPAAETAVGVGLLVTPVARLGGAACALLLVVFTGGILAALRRGERPDCHCFGAAARSRPVGPATVLRNGYLVALALAVAILGPGALPSLPGDAAAAGIALAVATVAVAAGLVALRAAGSRTASGASAGPRLPAGSPAPPFQLPSTAGATVSLDRLLAPGLPLLLVFTSPGCGACHELIPDLRRWQHRYSDRLTIAILGQGADPTGPAPGLRNQLVQAEREVSTAYLVSGTPSGVLVDAHGLVVRGPEGGPAAIEDLLQRALRLRG